MYEYLPVEGDVLFCLVDDLDAKSVTLLRIDGGTGELAIDSQDIVGVAKPGAWSFFHLHG